MKTSLQVTERFSIEYHKTKTKVIALTITTGANNSLNQSELEVRTRTRRQARESACELHWGQTHKATSHPVASALKICISSKLLQSEVRKKSLLEIQ